MTLTLHFWLAVSHGGFAVPSRLLLQRNKWEGFPSSTVPWGYLAILQFPASSYIFKNPDCAHTKLEEQQEDYTQVFVCRKDPPAS